MMSANSLNFRKNRYHCYTVIPTGSFRKMVFIVYFSRVMFYCISSHAEHLYGLLTKCEVKMAGYWPSSFSCVFMDRDGINTQKKLGQYPAILTEQAWSIKDSLYGFWGNFSCGTRRVVPSGQDGSILPARVANHSAGFDSSCPLAELAI